MDILSTLSELGLTKNKGRVYVELLQLGTASASETGARVHVPRTTALEVLNQLESQGLISSFVRNRKRIFTIESPQHLEQHFIEKKERAHLLLPELFALFAGQSIRPTVRVFDGASGVKRAFEETLRAKQKMLRGILSMEDLYTVPGKKFMNHYVAERIEKKITLNVVRSKEKEVEETWSSSAKELRELRYAPAQYTFPMTIYTFDHTVVLLGTKKEPFGVIIRSEGLALTMQNFFDLLWSVSKVTKPQ